MSIQNNKLLISDVMLPNDRFPVVGETIIFKEVLEKMNDTRLGIVCVVDNDSKLKGVITDGDIRRKLLKVQKPFSAFFVDDALVHAIKEPVTIGPNSTLIDAISLMKEKQIWDLPVTDSNNTLIGLLHLHPAIEALLGL